MQNPRLCAHRLVVADGVELSAEHNGCEGEEEEGLHAEEDHQHHRHGRGEITALWTQKNTVRVQACTRTKRKIGSYLIKDEFYIPGRHLLIMRH